jgi:hypothetical protein
MVTYAFLGVIILGTVLAFRDWRHGVLWGIAVGLLQDPVRKMTPGTPAIMAVSSFPVWLAVLLRLRVASAGAWLRLQQDWPRVARRMIVFVFLLLPPALLAFQYGLGAWRLVVIGLLGYVAPLVGVVMGYSFARSAEELRALIVRYCLMASAMMTGSLLEYAGLLQGWAAIGTESLGMRWVRYAGGGVFDLISGFFRSPDLMGWHAAALVMLALTLALSGRRKDMRWMVPAVLGAVCLLVAGRRKMVVMPVVWLVVVTVANVRAGRISRAATVTAIGAVTALGLFFAGREIAVSASYYEYARSVQDETTSRLLSGSWNDLWYTFQQSGFLGEGLGAASQGAQYVSEVRERSWQESGLSKLMIELGIPGFAWALVLGWTLAAALLACLARGSGLDRELLIGVIAFSAANAMSFIISHQVFGDLLVVTLSAIFVGVALSGQRWMRPGRA